jgi:hemerythrin-like domain-containing protein
MSTESLPIFAGQLSGHIRKEERQLFESLQQLMSEKDLSSLGIHLKEALKGAAQSCALPNERAKLQPRS